MGWTGRVPLKRGDLRVQEAPESGLPYECLHNAPPSPQPPSRCRSNCVFLPGSQFWVTVQRTEAAERCDLHGSYVLRVEAEKLTLLTVGAQSQILEPLLSWPYTLLRRYGRDKVRGLSGRAGFLDQQLWVKWAEQEGGEHCHLDNPSLPSP